MAVAAAGALGGALLALLALPGQRAASSRRVAAAALLLNLLVSTPPLYLYSRARSLPHIHDVSTDAVEPPEFVAVLPLRKGARNAVTYAPETAALQKSGYPDIVPLRLDIAPTQAFERATHAAAAMGWALVAVAPAEGRIEATATTLLFGFKDDVVIRVRAVGGGSVVDVRSLSRLGGSDLGVNADRVRAYLTRLTTMAK